MRKSIAAVVAAIAIVATTQSYAGSLAYIQQVDRTAFRAADTLASTEKLFGTAMETTAKLAAMAPQTGNLGWIDQLGDNNAASLVQGGGDGNVGFIQIVGNNNVASLEQNGGRNIGFISQMGNYNTAALQQTGTGHVGAIIQQGSNNTAILRQR